MQQELQQQFREEEIITMVHWDKQIGVQVTTPYPKIGGRLRIAHENNDQLSITSKVFSYDGQVAIVVATTTTDKGSYNGVGMAPVERDKKIAPAILELAESRAIARSLRFCGIGVEYCGAEEISHLTNGDNGDSVKERSSSKNNGPQEGFNPVLMSSDTQTSQKPNSQDNGRNGASNSTGGRLSNKQLVFLMRLATGRGMTKKELDSHCINVFGVAVDFLSKKEASTIIDEFNSVKEAKHG
jgi:hypothetical protein